MQAPNNNLTEIGLSGLETSGGYVYEERLPKLTGGGWQKAVRDMSNNDPVIGAVLNVSEKLTRAVSWEIIPFKDENEYQKDAEFIRGCLFNDMVYSWQDTLSEILSFLPWGWSYFELCYKRRGGESTDKTKDSRFDDGQIGWRKFGIRAQESLEEWVFDEFNEVEALIQRPAPNYETKIIPFEKALLFRASSHKENPEGRSILRNAYRPWYFKSNFENIEGIGVERDLAGLPVADMPPEYLDPYADETKKALLADVKLTLSSIRRDEKEYAIIPAVYDDKGNRTFDIRLLTTGGRRQFDTSAIIDRYDQRILMNTLADFLMLGSKSVGSFALSSDKTSLFAQSLEGWLDGICEQINRHAIPRLQKLNGKRPNESPKLIRGKVENVSLKDIGNYVRETSGAGVDYDENQQDWLKQRIHGMPISEKEDSNS